MKIKKAVITAAGYGTRFFPLTKTIQKEMVPILNRPIVDYIVEDCINAGVQEIIFVVKEKNSQLEHFYTESLGVKNYLERMGKMDKYPELEEIHKKAKFKFVIQDEHQPYGTATPLKLVKDLVENEKAFFMFMGDDFILSKDTASEASKMLDLFEKSDSKALATFIEKPREIVHKYGVARIREEKGFSYLIDIYEKPTLGKEPSTLVNLSKYIFTPEIYDALDSQELNSEHNELLITDTLTIFAKSQKVVIHPTSGDYMDSGYVEGWLKANMLLASKDKELFNSLKSYMDELYR